VSPPPGGQVTTADGDVLTTAARDLAALGARFAAGDAPLRAADTDLREGAGDVAHLLADSADLFQTSWTDVLDVCSEACGTVAGNLGRFVTDLTAADVAAGQGYSL
jgi:ABC-type transporter Mla subunit MlaD